MVRTCGESTLVNQNVDPKKYAPTKPCVTTVLRKVVSRYCVTIDYVKPKKGQQPARAPAANWKCGHALVKGGSAIGSRISAI